MKWPNLITWIRNAIDAYRRREAFHDFREKHASSVLVTADDRVMQALTYQNERIALANMPLNFDASDEVVAQAVATARIGFGFGPTQQAYGLYWLNRNHAFTSQGQFEMTVQRAAGGNPVWYRSLLDLVGPAKLNNDY